jgi:hypothetical protein
MNINSRYTSDNDDNNPESLPEDIFGEHNEDDRPQRQLQAFELIQEVQDLTTHLRKLTVMNFMVPTWKAIEEIKYMSACLHQAQLYLGEIVKNKRPYIEKQFPEK